MPLPGSCIVGQLVTTSGRPSGARGVTAVPPAALWVPGSSAPGMTGAVQLICGSATVMGGVHACGDDMFLTVHLLFSRMISVKE